MPASARATLAWWEEVMGALGRPVVAQLVLTHYHPDHLGASAGLAHLTGAAEIVQGRLDRSLAVAAWERRRRRRSSSAT